MCQVTITVILAHLLPLPRSTKVFLTEHLLDIQRDIFPLSEIGNKCAKMTVTVILVYLFLLPREKSIILGINERYSENDLFRFWNWEQIYQDNYYSYLGTSVAASNIEESIILGIS